MSGCTTLDHVYPIPHPPGTRCRCGRKAWTAITKGDTMETTSILDAIRPGDRVTIRDRFGKDRTGRAVMRGPAGWVLNMGGPHGTPGIATDANIVKVKAVRK